METVDKYFAAFKIKHIKDVDKKELKRRYRILVKKYHPDKGGNPATFRFITEAYNYLLELRIQLDNKESKKFFSSKHLVFYADGSVFNTKTNRWAKYKGRIINIKP